MVAGACDPIDLCLRDVGFFKRLRKSSKNGEQGKAFEALCELLQEHFKPKGLEVAVSYRFHRCCQEENETVSVHSARLRHLASTCNFGEFLNHSLRDQFVCGLRNPLTRRKFLSQDRTFQEARQVATDDEIAATETLQVQEQQLSQSVNSISKETFSCGISRSRSTSRPSPNQTSPMFQPVSSYACLSCGNSDHERSKCKFRNAVCRHCKLRGHIVRVCKKGGVNNMGFEEESLQEKLSDDDELFM
ncbi:uncharacterized protein [Montipora capricornis]|uniref:uncharacterized protein n=1 Tax=Montipora capricornis TaxID=246305 RepID=UPI0035F11F9C